MGRLVSGSVPPGLHGRGGMDAGVRVPCLLLYSILRCLPWPELSGLLLPGYSSLSPPSPSGVSVPLCVPSWLHKTCLFGIDGGDLGDSSHLDHPFGILPQLQVPQGGVQQVPDHLIVDLMGQVGDRYKRETEDRRSRQGPGSPPLPSEKGTAVHRWGWALQHPQETIKLPEPRIRGIKTKWDSLRRQAGHRAEDGGLSDGRPCLLLGNLMPFLPLPHAKWGS